MIKEPFDYIPYLSVKKYVDDESLNTRVWKAMVRWMEEGRRDEGPLRVLELGAGIGTMIERLLDARLLKRCHYTALEVEPGFQEGARLYLDGWCRAHACRLHGKAGGRWRLDTPAGEAEVEIQWITGDVLEAPAMFAPGSFDLVIGHAVIDLLPVPRCLPAILGCVRPGGGCYFSVNYAGRTLFRPGHPLDGAVMDAYHRDMDTRFPELEWKPSQTGRHLGKWLREQGHRLVAEGASDWVLSPVAPDTDAGRFTANILDTVEKALAGLPGLPEWMDARRRQLESGELRLRAANRDCFSVVGES